METRYSRLKFESRQPVLLSDSSSIWERIEAFPSRFIKTLENLEKKRGSVSNSSESGSAPFQAKKRQKAPQNFFLKNTTIW